MRAPQIVEFVAAHWRSLLAAMALGGLTSLGLIGAGALIVVEGGLFNTTSSAPHSPIVSWATHATFKHSVRLRSSKSLSRPAFTPAEVQAGSQQYQADCAMCHGGPGVARAPWVRGLTPTPPFLLDASRRWTPDQLYFIVDHGVKMTAMPAWGETRTPAQVWSLVAFLDALPDLTPEQYRRMTAAIHP
jgi:cytochrome c5